MTAVAVAVGVVLLVAGGALVALGLATTPRSGARRLRTVLEHGAFERVRPSEQTALPAVWSALARRAERLGRHSSVFGSLTLLLDRAGWALRASEFVVALAGASLAGAVVAGVLAAGLLAAVAGALAAPALVLAVAVVRGRRERARAEEQLPDVLDQLGASLRSGYSLSQAMAAVAESASAPLGPQLARVLGETRVGRPLDEALEALATRVGSTDLQWSVRAMIIQSRTGGSLAEILDILAEFMREREEIRREVRALTADGRISALVLSLLPVAVAALLFAVRPGYLTPLFVEPLGRLLLLAAVALLGVSVVWVRKLVRIEV